MCPDKFIGWGFQIKKINEAVLQRKMHADVVGRYQSLLFTANAICRERSYCSYEECLAQLDYFMTPGAKSKH
jgi:hypothetical protein